jgi:hypothetical protein
MEIASVSKCQRDEACLPASALGRVGDYLWSDSAAAVLTIRRVFALPSTGLNDLFSEIQSEDTRGHRVDCAQRGGQ